MSQDAAKVDLKHEVKEYIPVFLGAPDRTRTCGTQIRNLVLYPPELRGHIKGVGW